MSVKHSPRPWRVCNEGRCSCGTISCADHPIAKIVSGKWGDDYPAIRLVGESSLDYKAEAYLEQITYGEIDAETAMANARLIAAAPDLLEATRRARKYLDESLKTKPHEGDEHVLHAFLSNAIARAEGRS